MRMSANISTSEVTQNRSRKKAIARIYRFCVRLVSFLADNKGIVSHVDLRLWRATVSNLRIACVAVSNLAIWGPYIGN